MFTTSKKRAKTSTPVVRLAYIPTCRSPLPQTVNNTGRHRATGSSVSLSHRGNDRGTGCRLALAEFFHFLAWGLTLGQSSPKGEMTWWTPRSTTLQNFIALHQPTPEISVTKNPADKQTVTDVSAACGDNNGNDKGK